MRYFFLMAVVFWAAVYSLAQSIPEGPSLLVTDAPKKQSNETLQIKVSGQDVSDYSPPSIGIMSNAAINAEPPAATAPDTNSVNSGQILFLMNAGVQYESEGAYAEAEKAYLQALEKEPENPEILVRLSTVYIQMKRDAEAVAILEALGERFPDNAVIHNNLAWVYASSDEMKNGKLAKRNARDALMAGPYSPSVWNTLAEAYYVCGEYDEALRSSAFAMELLKAMEKPSEADIASFGAQHTKIQRAAAVYKRLQGDDGDQ